MGVFWFILDEQDMVAFPRLFSFCVCEAVLGLHCFVQAFSGCSEWGLPSCDARASHRGGFSCFLAQALGTQASVVAACGFSS